MRRRRRRRRPTWHAPLPLLARMLDHLLALCRAGVVPLLAQHLAALRRQLLKAAEVLPNRRLLVRRQGLKMLPPATQRLPLIRRERPPTREAIARSIALYGRHGKPALAAVRQRLLPRRRKRAPLTTEAREQ